MRTAFIRTLIDLARADRRIFFLVGDVGYSLVEPYAQEFPERFVNVGIAEQDMIGIATGLALSGKVVFVYSLANFPTIRCVEQIRNDVCYHQASVNIVASGGGLAYGALGATHHTLQDLAIMRALPQMTVVAPGDPEEVEPATRAVAQLLSPCYLRLENRHGPTVYNTIPPFQIGKALLVREGGDITLIAVGGILCNVVQAADRLRAQGIEARVLSMHTLKPLDTEAVLAAARETKAIATIEEHSIIGGLGSAVAEVLAESGATVRFKRIGINDSFCTLVGSQEYLREAYFLSVEGIVSSVHSLMSEAIHLRKPPPGRTRSVSLRKG